MLFMMMLIFVMIDMLRFGIGVGDVKCCDVFSMIVLSVISSSSVLVSVVRIVEFFSL